MIDNLEQIKELLTFDSEDDFYMVQIIKRKKEHPDLGSNNHMVKAYYISSLDGLERDYPEMKCLATFHNARVMINLNKRSYEKLAYQALLKTTNCIMNKDYKSVRKTYNTVAGQYSNESNKKWIVDIDYHEKFIIMTIVKEINELYLYIEDGKGKASGCVYDILPTKNGHHIICSPFNTKQFNDKMESFTWTIDIHKDNPTILYIP